MSRNAKNMLHLWEMIQSAKFGVKQTQCATVGLNKAKWGISGLLVSISFTVNQGWELRTKHLFGVHYGFQKHLRTREYSGRKRKAHLQTGHISVVPTRCHSRKGPQVNKFELVSSVGHQMSVAVGVAPGLMSWGTPTISPIPWCIWCYLPTLWTDRRLWKHYLPKISFAGGKEPLCRR